LRQPNRDLLRVTDHMVVGDNVTIRADNNPIFTTAGMARAAISVKESGWAISVVKAEGGLAPLTELSKPNTGGGSPHRLAPTTMAPAIIRK
jgi:hypothetical protein